MTEQNNTAPLLSVRDLQVVYHTKKHDVHAVNGISFDIQRKKTLGFVGETGAGKTTTALSLLRLLPERTAKVLHGSILFEGKDLMQLSERDMQKIRGEKIAMIFQDPMTALNPTVTVGEQIAEALLLHSQKGTSMEKIHQRVDEVLMLVGIPPERKKEYPHQFSGGMKQRVVIAIALACEPELLIADEPTTALDVTIQAQILELINKLKKERNLSIIFITHDLGVVANMADRIAVMYAGKVVEYGTSREIFYEPAHPYTWALLSSMPDLDSKDRLEAIPGTPPDMRFPPKGDAFAKRNQYALQIDFEKQPPEFPISETHWAATWLLHPKAPKVDPPKAVVNRIEKMKQRAEVTSNG